MPESTIYIFDNSDKDKFTYRQENLVYFDNTNGQIINFTEWLKNYPDRQQPCYSPKHAYTIQKIMDILNKPFILLDSDVLLKRDISELYDENYAFIGEEKTGRSPRILPFLCFLNPKKLKECRVKYFDGEKMLNLQRGVKFDTGYPIFVKKDILPHKLIKNDDYIVHYRGGSYDEKVFNILHKGQIGKKEWIEQYKELWN